MFRDILCAYLDILCKVIYSFSFLLLLVKYVKIKVISSNNAIPDMYMIGSDNKAINNVSKKVFICTS